jgi:cystathionine beta-lyase/cystathionine gamma-synthase
MTHSSFFAEACQHAGITGGRVRLSMGLHNPEDIIADLAQALCPGWCCASSMPGRREPVVQ